MSKKKNISSTKISESKSVQSVIARSDDGTIQFTFTVPYSQIKEAQDKALEELSKDIEIPGFRKGKAPLSKVAEKIPQNTLVEKAMAKILPKLFSNAIKEHKITPTVYPKFELVKAQPNEDWQIRATTCEFPEINLGDYKKEISEAKKTSSIWTPDKGKPEDEKTQELTREQKEQEIMKILLEKVNVKIPKILIDEEVNSRLSKLLERIEKLGLTLESYLASLGKSADQLRKEYKKQAEDALKLDFILIKIAEEKKISIDKNQVDLAIQTSASADPNIAKKLDTPEQRRLIETILKRRAVLDSLVSLASFVTTHSS